MITLNAIRKVSLSACTALALTIGLSSTTAKAARLGHPAYSAAGATAAQKQWNLVCDPSGATSGSTSTKYDPNVAALSVINAAQNPDFQIDHVNVLLDYGDGYTIVQQFPGDGTYDSETETYSPYYFDPGTTSVTFMTAVPSFSAALAALPSSTFAASLSGPEGGYVQIFWSVKGTTHDEGEGEVSAANSLHKAHVCPGPIFGGGNNADTVTHTITFVPAASNANPFAAVFTNFANGDPAFFVNGLPVFDEFDGYSGTFNNQPFSYVEGDVQIAPATTTIKLTSPCKGGGGKKIIFKHFHDGDDYDGGYGKKH